MDFERRSKSANRKNRIRNKKRYQDEEIGNLSMNVGDNIDDETLEDIIGDSSGGREGVLTKSPFFYDLRVLRHPKKRNGETKGGLWIHMLIWFGIALYSALAVMEALEIVDIGWNNPLFYLIFHWVLTAYFGLLLVWAAGSFIMEPLLSDNLRPAIIVGHAFFVNGISGILFLIWIVKHTNLIYNANFDKDPEATMDYKDVVIVCFVLYILWITVILLTYVIRFAFAKFIEILSMVVRQLDKNPTSDYLETLLYKSNQYLNNNRKKSFGLQDIGDRSSSSGYITMMEKKHGTKQRPKPTKRRSRSRGGKTKAWSDGVL